MALLLYVPPIVHDSKVHETLHVKVTGILDYGIHPISVDSILFELVEKDIEDGKKAKIYGTPTFFINNRTIVGPKPIKAFKEIIEEELKK